MTPGPRKVPPRPASQPTEAGHGPVLDASPNPIVAVDRAARITYANPQVEKTFGYTSSELLGQAIELLLPDRVSERHIAHRDKFLAHPVGRPMGIGLDLSGRRKDGSEFPVEISLSPVETSDGLQVFATVVDITARKAAVAALAESERRFRAVLEASPNVILAVDSAGVITYANPRTATAFGYTRDELLGKPIELLLPDRVRGRHVSHREAFLANPMARPMGVGRDLAGRRKNGSEFPVEISVSPVETADGVQAFATVVDITARKAAEGQLLQAQKLESLGRLSGGIAHDFNNMLFAIRGYAELLTQDLSPDNRAKLDPDGSLRSVQAIQRAAEGATILTSQLLAFSRQQVISPKVLDVNLAIVSVEPMVRRLIGENILLTLKLDAAAGHVRTDPGQLEQILVNLVINARDAMPDGGAITIETGNTAFDEPYAVEHFDVLAGSYVLLAVSDTGLGMDRATREHIFEPFFTTKELGKGTGLGLATTYGIVRQAGGHIWLHSEPGQGTSFKIYFPRIDAPVTDEEPEAPTSSGGVGTVLVVEDEPAVRDMTTQLLERAGYRVVAVADGEEAIALSDEVLESIDVLVTDVIMPRMSGIVLAEVLMDRYPRLGTVLLSGYTAETMDLERITARGAIFVPKPVTSGQLLLAVVRAGPMRRAGV